MIVLLEYINIDTNISSLSANKYKIRADTDNTKLHQSLAV